MADPPFGFHVDSMPGAEEKSGCREPRDAASVLDGEAKRGIRSAPGALPQFRISRNERARRSTLLDETSAVRAPHLDSPHFRVG